MTLPGAFNYGNRLQNYAIMKIYSSLGFIPTTLILDNFQVLRKVRRALFKLLGRPVHNNEAEMSIARREAFSRFDRLIKVKKSIAISEDGKTTIRSFPLAAIKYGTLVLLNIGCRGSF